MLIRVKIIIIIIASFCKLQTASNNLTEQFFQPDDFTVTIKVTVKVKVNFKVMICY